MPPPTASHPLSPTLLRPLPAGARRVLRPPLRRPVPGGGARRASYGQLTSAWQGLNRRPPDCPRRRPEPLPHGGRSEEHTSELQSRQYLVCRLLLAKKKKHTK